MPTHTRTPRPRRHRATSLPDRRDSQRLRSRRILAGTAPLGPRKRQPSTLRFDAHAPDIAALLHAPDVTELCAAIVRWGQRCTSAHAVELQLLVPSVTAAPTHALRARSTIPTRSKQRLALVLHDGSERLATLRLEGARPARLGALRAYLHHAGPALGWMLRLERARQQSQRYEALLTHAPDWCVLVLSRDGVVQEIHTTAAGPLADSAAWRGQSLDGKRGGRAPFGLSHAHMLELLEAARRTGHARCETRLPAADGEVDVQLILSPIGDGGEMLCVLRDLSAVRAIEKALLRRNQELSEAAERLKEIDMLKNEFMSNVSHELRTPLTAIIAYAEAILLTRPPPATTDQFLKVIAEQGHKLQKLIGGLLDIAKLDSLATELKLQLGSLNQVVEAAVVTVRPTADKNQIRIQMELDPDLPPVYLDELRSQQIVWNLIANAIKFSPPQAQVRVRTWSEAGEVWAAVTDEGIGIAPEHHELIFQKFVQIDGSSTRRHGGVGLGLDLVKHLVELHGGKVRVDSQLGHGSTFSFSIPMEKRRRPRGVVPRSERVGRAT